VTHFQDELYDEIKTSGFKALFLNNFINAIYFLAQISAEKQLMAFRMTLFVLFFDFIKNQKINYY